MSSAEASSAATSLACFIVFSCLKNYRMIFPLHQYHTKQARIATKKFSVEKGSIRRGKRGCCPFSTRARRPFALWSQCSLACLQNKQNINIYNFINIYFLKRKLSHKTLQNIILPFIIKSNLKNRHCTASPTSHPRCVTDGPAPSPTPFLFVKISIIHIVILFQLHYSGLYHPKILLLLLTDIRPNNLVVLTNDYSIKRSAL